MITKLLLEWGAGDIALPVQAAKQLLRDIYLTRKQRNPAYSMRAYARDLGVSQTLVSLLLNGKRQISLKLAAQICQTLELTDTQTEQLLKNMAFESAGASAPPRSEIHQLELDRFRVIGQWYHFALLDLTTTDNFKPKEVWIAKRLGITVVEVKDAAERLVRLGLLEIRKSKWIKTQSRLYVPTKQSHEAVRSFHKQMITKALDALASPHAEDFVAREISGTTMSIDPKHLPKAKELIKEFQEKFGALVSQGVCTEVYQLNVQFFSLTKKEGKLR